MYDILIKNGLYPDFKTMQLVRGDVAVTDGKITAIGELDGPAKEVIDASGHIVSPGFIDIHMHEESFVTEGHECIISNLMLQMGVTTGLGGSCGVIRQDIRTFKSILDELGGFPMNILMQSGYNTFRTELGISRYEAASDEQIRIITEKLQDELKQGAYGVSFGLEYDPGIPSDEVIKVMKSFPDEDMYFSMHYRADSTGAIDSINEMINFTNETGKRFQISHLSSCSAMGQMEEALKLINDAVAKNPKLDYDTYPYNAFSTRIGTAVFDDGCFESWGKTYSDIYMPSGKYANQYCTKETFEELRRDDPNRYVVAFAMNEDEIAAAIANPACGMIASDGQVKDHAGHPRAAGTFPRVLGKYVREDKVISMIDALKKMTIVPAERLTLHNKGRIEVGCDADLTIFNPETVKDGATFENIFIKPTGIDYVVLDGKLAVKDGEIVNARAGKFIPGPYTK
ncbi:MAG: amidohydrolase family protein [Firmicutes bacterium]|nr:amidohydrolase family protein [Bacillota bacterium]